MPNNDRLRQLLDLAMDGDEEAAHDLYAEYGVMVNASGK